MTVDQTGDKMELDIIVAILRRCLQCSVLLVLLLLQTTTTSPTTSAAAAAAVAATVTVYHRVF